MRIRKDQELFEEKDIELIARVSDALAHPCPLETLQIYYAM